MGTMCHPSLAAIFCAGVSHGSCYPFPRSIHVARVPVKVEGVREAEEVEAGYASAQICPTNPTKLCLSWALDVRSEAS